MAAYKNCHGQRSNYSEPSWSERGGGNPSRPYRTDKHDVMPTMLARRVEQVFKGTMLKGHEL